MPATLRERLAALFRGLDRAHGIYKLLQRPAGGKKIVGKAATVRGEVTAELWDAHLAGKQGLGIVPITDNGTCWFGAVDVDRYDIRIVDVEAQCAKLGLPLLPTRTKSGGVHLYVFGKEPLSARTLRERLGEWSVALGFGGAEIFPKQDALLSTADVGNWINMPYYGAASGKTERFAILNGEPLDLEGFLDRAERLQLTVDQLEALVLVTPSDDDYLNGPPCLQSLARRGFGEGMRNDGLFAVGVYLKKRYPDDWKAHLLAHNAKYMKPPLPEAEVRAIAKALARKDYNYTCNKPPIKNFCNRTLCRTREFGVGKGLDDWGIVIDSDAQKIATDPPYWLVSVNGVRVKLFSDDLMQQRSFQKICLERVGLLPPALPADKWREEVNKLLQSAETVEAPPDASVVGELNYHLKQFCTVYPQAETREEIVVGKPFTFEGFTYFRAADFKKYLESQHFRALNGHRLYAELRGLGLEHRQFWVAERNLTCWVVKAFAEPVAAVPVRRAKDTEGSM